MPPQRKRLASSIQVVDAMRIDRTPHERPIVDLNDKVKLPEVEASAPALPHEPDAVRVRPEHHMPFLWASP